MKREASSNDGLLAQTALHALPSLSDYVLVAQDKPHIELYTRQVDGSWRFSEARGLQSRLTIPSIDCTLALADVYQRVQVSDTDE